jgi:hypothetical protein
VLQPENPALELENRLPYEAPTLSEFEVNQETATGLIVGPEGTTHGFMYSPVS